MLRVGQREKTNGTLTSSYDSSHTKFGTEFIIPRKVLLLSCISWNFLLIILDSGWSVECIGLITICFFSFLFVFVSVYFDFRIPYIVWMEK